MRTSTSSSPGPGISHCWFFQASVVKQSCLSRGTAWLQTDPDPSPQQHLYSQRTNSLLRKNTCFLNTQPSVLGEPGQDKQVFSLQIPPMHSLSLPPCSCSSQQTPKFWETTVSPLAHSCLSLQEGLPKVTANSPRDGHRDFHVQGRQKRHLEAQGKGNSLVLYPQSLRPCILHCVPTPTQRLKFP